MITSQGIYSFAKHLLFLGQRLETDQGTWDTAIKQTNQQNNQQINSLPYRVY